MRSLILVLIVSMTFFDSHSQNKELTLVLSRIEIKCENEELLDVLSKIVSHEQEKYGKVDTLYYDFLISRTSENIRGNIDNYESVYITGIDTRWSIPPRAFKSILGYIRFDNMFFIVSNGGGFSQDYFSNLFLIKNIKRPFAFKEYKDIEVVEDDDTVVRIWCRFLYKEGNIKVFDTSCRDNNGDLYLFKK